MHHDTWAFYECWRKNRSAFDSEARPRGLEIKTLEMFHELKTRDPAPWIMKFNDASDVTKSLQREFVNQLYSHLAEQEKRRSDEAAYLLNKVMEAAPDIRAKVEAEISPTLVREKEELRERLVNLEIELEKAKGSVDKYRELEVEKMNVEARLSSATSELGQAKVMLAQAALKDVSWLDLIRRTMMPKQPGRVPFHHSGEVALRGYHARVNRTVPNLTDVTWAKVDPSEGPLKRQYGGAVVFKGSNFLPGVVLTHRKIGDGLPAGRTDYIWNLPHIYFGDYLERGGDDDELRAPLSWRGREFCLRNPEGELSDWVPFTYPFDDALLESKQAEYYQLGMGCSEAGDYREAMSCFHKAWLFADRLFGSEHAKTAESKEMGGRVTEQYKLSQLRFRPGVKLTVVAGPHAGKSGTVDRLLLNHHHAYLVRPNEGEEFQAADDQVELDMA